jgi:hypothetical protein
VGDAGLVKFIPKGGEARVVVKVQGMGLGVQVQASYALVSGLFKDKIQQLTPQSLAAVLLQYCHATNFSIRLHTATAQGLSLPGQQEMGGGLILVIALDLLGNLLFDDENLAPD